MSTNEFDKLIVEKFDQHEFGYNPARWDKLSRELGEPEQKTKKVIPFTGGWLKTAAMAAGVVAVVSVFGWLYTGTTDHNSNVANTQTKQKAEQKITRETQSPQTAIAASAEGQSAEDVTPVEQPVRNATQSPDNTSNIAAQTPARIAQQVQPVANVNKTPPASETTVATADQNKPKPVQDETKPAGAVVTFRETPQTPAGNSRGGQHIDLSHMPEPMAARQRTSDASIGLTGGMNYGSLNAGYTAGVTARKKIAGKVFVEGDLAFVSNKADQATMSETAFNVVANGDVNNLGTPIVNASTGERTMTVDAASSNFNYVQFTPSLGYQVAPKIALSVGADFQRLLGYDEGMKNVVYQDEQTRLAPTFDVGITGKTEVAVTRKLKAGLLYREGVNNLVRGSATNQYLERRYLQVQLKFMVFDKK